MNKQPPERPALVRCFCGRPATYLTTDPGDLVGFCQPCRDAIMSIDFEAGRAAA